ncbi:mitogen-activated protein kinase-binding protein 1-like [Notothenia coriiceps]|uniref:Mitogen-activated protein kinase-binding protein 1-like n=1 Tax=Notothenia coriiceps TaxID=8208 RepID=A0A6I9P682_9TELE|nr:PREDICTED: mitogen-activated protein kinase-binding protein 1-like [Notothenia coriiceps]
MVVPNQAYLFAIDIDGLYTNINTVLGLQAVSSTFTHNPDHLRPDSHILQLLSICLNNNDFTFNNQHFLQIHGTAMGQRFAPSYANIYMSEQEVYSSSDSEHEEEKEDEAGNDDPEFSADITSSEEKDSGGSDEGQDWELMKQEVVNQVTSEPSKRPRRRWSQRICALELKVKSMLDLRHLESFSHKKNPNCSPDRERGNTFSLQEPMLQFEERAKRHRPWPHAAWLPSNPSKGTGGADGGAPYCEGSEGDARLQASDYTVKEQCCRTQGRGVRSGSKESRSPDSACSLGYNSRGSSQNSVLDDSADFESLSQEISDEENEEREEEEQKAEETSMEEALRKVTETSDHGREDPHKQNIGILEESHHLMEQSRAPRLSMSSRFLTRRHNNRSMPLFANLHDKEQCSRFAKPPVSKVRPLMEDSRSRNMEYKTPGRIEGQNDLPAAVLPLSKADSPVLRPMKRRKTSLSNLWRMSNQPSKAPLMPDSATCLQKSHSVQDLASDPPRSPVPSSDPIELRKRLQQLVLDQDNPQPSSHLSSPSSGSPRSLDSPLPWDSPKLKSPNSYMKPTASSKAKGSRSNSLGDVRQTGSPPCSPSPLGVRRSRGAMETGSPLAISSPVTSFSFNISSTSSLAAFPLSNSPPPTPTEAVSPSPFTQNLPPTRIPLPRQPLSPRRSFCFDGTQVRAFTPSVHPEGDVTPTPGNRGLGKRFSKCLSLDPSLQSLLPVRQKRDSVSESAKEPSQVAVARECPLVPEQVHTSIADPKPDHSITLETCRQAVTELHNSLRKIAMLYTTMLQCDQQPGEDQTEMRGILSKALFKVKAELDSLSPPSSQSEGPPVDQGVKGEGDRTLALLEQYAELLLKSVERRLDTKT